MCLTDKVVKKAPHVLPNKNVLLRDQFIEHVSDSHLCRELMQVVRGHPAATLIDVRSEAIRWEKEGMPRGGNGRSNTVPSVLGFQHTVLGSHSNQCRAGSLSFGSKLGELREILRR